MEEAGQLGSVVCIKPWRWNMLRICFVSTAQQNSTPLEYFFIDDDAPNIMRLSWFLLWRQCACPSSFQCTTLNSWCMPSLAPNAKVLHCFPNDTAKEHSKQTRSEVCPNSFLLTSHANCAGAKLLMTVSCKGIKPRTTGTRSPPPPSPRWARCHVTKAALMGQSATVRAAARGLFWLRLSGYTQSDVRQQSAVPCQQQIRSQRLQGFSWKVSLWKLNTSCPCPCLSWQGWSTKSIKNHQVTVGFTNQVNLDRHCSGPSVLAPFRLFSLNVPESCKLGVWSMTCIMFNLSERCIENRFCNWLSCSIIPSCVSTSVWARILVIVASVPPSINDLHCFCDTIEFDQQQIWRESTLLLFFVKLTSEIRDESFINAIIVKLSFKLRRMTMTID